MLRALLLFLCLTVAAAAQPRTPTLFTTPTRHLGVVATRNQVNQFLGGAHQMMSVTTHWMRAAVDPRRGIALVVPNFYVSTSTGEGGSGAVASTTATLEYPPGTCARFTFSGSTTGSVPNNSYLVSDFETAIIPPPGAVFNIRMWWSSTGGIVYSDSQNTAMLSTEGLNYGTTETDLTACGSGAPAYQTELAFFPAAIIGYTNQTGVCELGDSRDQGVADTATTATFGDIGEIARSVGPLYPYIHLSVSGAILYKELQSFGNRRALTQYCTHLTDEYGVNDLGNGPTVAQLETNVANLVGMFPPTMPVWATTLPPETSSTDGWATPTPGSSSPNHQTPTTGDSLDLLYNTDLRNGVVTSIRGYMEMANVVTNLPGTSYWWGPGCTGGGIHELQLCALAEQNAGIVPVGQMALPAGFVPTPIGSAIVINSLPAAFVSSTLTVGGVYYGPAPTGLTAGAWGGGCTGSATFSAFSSTPAANGTGGIFTATATTPSGAGTGCTLTATASGLTQTFAATTTSLVSTTIYANGIAFTSLTPQGVNYTTTGSGTWAVSAPTGLTAAVYGNGCTGSATVSGFSTGTNTWTATFTTPSSVCTGTLTVTEIGGNSGSATSPSTAFTAQTLVFSTLNVANPNSTTTGQGSFNGAPPSGLTSATYGGGCSGSATVSGFSVVGNTWSATFTTPSSVCTGTLTVTGTGANTLTATSPSVMFITYSGPADAASATVYAGWCPTRGCTTMSAAAAVAAIGIINNVSSATFDSHVLTSGALDAATAISTLGTDATCTSASAVSSTTLTLSGCSAVPHQLDTFTGSAATGSITLGGSVASVGTFTGGAGTYAGTVVMTNVTPTSAAQTFTSTSLAFQPGGLVTEVYDQGANGYNCIYASGKRPQLFLFGGGPSGGLPFIHYTAGQYCVTGTMASQAQPYTFSVVVRRTSNFTSTAVAMIANYTNTNANIGFTSASNTLQMFAYNGVGLPVAAADGAYHTVQAYFSGASSVFCVDGAAANNSSGGTTGITNQGIYLGAGVSSSLIPSLYFYGDIEDALLFVGSTNRQATTNNQGSYYGITVGSGC